MPGVFSLLARIWVCRSCARVTVDSSTTAHVHGEGSSRCCFWLAWNMTTSSRSLGVDVFKGVLLDLWGIYLRWRAHNRGFWLAWNMTATCKSLGVGVSKFLCLISGDSTSDEQHTTDSWYEGFLFCFFLWGLPFIVPTSPDSSKLVDLGHHRKKTLAWTIWCLKHEIGPKDCSLFWFSPLSYVVQKWQRPSEKGTSRDLDVIVMFKASQEASVESFSSKLQFPETIRNFLP